MSTTSIHRKPTAVAACCTAIPTGYKRVEVGVIPEEWEVYPVGRMGDVVIGKALAVNGAGKQRPYLRTKNVFDGHIDTADVLTMPMTDAQFAQFKLLRGDVLLNEGQSLDLVGRCAIYQEEYPQACAIQNQLLRFRARARVSAAFASHLFRYCQQTGIFARIALQTTSIAHLGGSRFKRLQLLWPKREAEQHAIAETLSDVDELLGALGSLLVKKRAIKQASLQQLLTGKTRLPGFSADWETMRLGDLAEMRSGGTPSTSVADYYDGDIPWVSISDMTAAGKFIENTERNLSAAGLANSAARIFTVGTVLYAMYASIGECCIAATPVSSSQAILGIRTTPRLHYEYLFYRLVALQPTIRAMGQQGTQANLNASMVRGFELSLPPVEEQIAIAAVLADMDTEIAALEHRRDKTRAIKQGMMQQLLTGRVRLIKPELAEAKA